METPLAHYPNVDAMVEALRPSQPVYCLNPNAIRQAAERFVSGFPGDVLYAVKCNTHPTVLKSLSEGGIRHFDAASLPEITDVTAYFPDAGIYFMHPVKSRDVIKTAYAGYGVRFFAVDCEDELVKVLGETESKSKKHDAVIIVRMATPDAGAVFNLSSKFGARPDEAVQILRRAHGEGATVGISFHVGSQCDSPEAFHSAVLLAGEVIEAADVPISYLDIGGGFPAQYEGPAIPTFDDFMATITGALDKITIPKGCRLLAEPGRALVADGMSLITQVHLRKGDKLHLNDGVFGSLQETLIGTRYPVRLIRPDGGVAAESRAFTAFGPTCDSYDVLSHPLILPADVREGDWIEFANVGAYSLATRTQFNGFFNETFVTVDDSRAHVRAASVTNIRAVS